MKLCLFIHSQKGKTCKTSDVLPIDLWLFGCYIGDPCSPRGIKVHREIEASSQFFSLWLMTPHDQQNLCKPQSWSTKEPQEVLSNNKFTQSFRYLHPWNLTWNLKINPWKRWFLLETIIFRFHVKFRGSNMEVLNLFKIVLRPIWKKLACPNDKLY